MRIAFHLGAHFTDEDRLLKCLLKNRDLLAGHGTFVPGPKRYRRLLRETMVALRGQAASPEAQEDLLRKIAATDKPDRLVLSSDGFMSVLNYVSEDQIYPTAGPRIRALTRIFSEEEAEFFLAIRNPAAILPTLMAKQQHPPGEKFLPDTDPFELRWSNVIDRIMLTNPDARLTVWCDEDTSLIWPEVLCALAGLPAGTRLTDDDELLASIMSEDGMTRLRGFLQSHPPTSIAQRRKIVATFLERFARPDRIVTELEMPGWTEETIAELTQIYQEDVARIAAMDDVTFLAP